MGYDAEQVANYANVNRIRINTITEKLLGYVYNGDECTYPFKNRRNPKDLRNMRFGRLKVVDMKGRRCTCICDCGNEVTALAHELLRNDIKSCGCRKRENRAVYYNSMKNGLPTECRMLSYKGKVLTVTDWARQPEVMALGIKRRNIYCRLRRGWSIEKTLTTPSKNLQ